MNITLTETQLQSLSYSHVDFDFYINSIVEGQVKLAEDEIIKQTVQHCIDNSIQIPTTRQEIVQYAFDNSVVKTAVDRKAEATTSTLGA